jgi:membrane protein DedA with SNARE-associated domain/membrane-associated phospholipid phosphatase/putative flippase GtrA
VQQILHLVVQYGYLIILFGVMAESTGVPLPGETILIASGILAQRGSLDFGDAILFGILGAVIGDQIGYWVGRRGGRPFVLRYGRYVLITPERLGRAEAFFARHGGKAVFLARFFSGLRVFGALVAGTSRMRWATFLLYNALGGAIWATAVVLVGYLLGGSLGAVERWLGKASLLLGILAVIAIILYLLYDWAAKHPERLGNAFERLGGGRMERFLGSTAGLWLRRRFSPREAYGLTLTAGLALMGLFSWAFGGIAEDLLGRDPLVRVDVRILEFFRSHGAPALTKAVLIFDSVFSPEVILLVSVAAGGGLLFLGHKRRDFLRAFAGIVLLAAALGTEALSELFKILFDRPRPPASLGLVHEVGTSFPSSQAMAAVAVGATLWYLFSLRPAKKWGGSWRAKARVGLAVVALALLTGLGQMYTGAHYPSDVVGGWALGGVWASVCLTAAELFRRLRAEGRLLPETGVRYAQFSLVGASNALVDLGTLNLLLLIWPTRIPAVLVLFNLAALVLTNANSYLWNTLWTFRHHARHDARQVGMFAAQAALGIGVGSLALWLVARGLVAYENLSPLAAGNAAKVASMIVGSTISFVLLRFVVLRCPEKE